MKNIILSAAVALFAVVTVGSLSSFNTNTAFVKKDNAKWTKGPCVSNNTITGMATGLGTGPYELRVQGKYDCVNKGSQTPSSANWSNLDVTVPVSPKNTGGNFKITAVIPSQCDHANWTFITTDLTVTLLQNGQVVIGPTPVASTCQ